METSVPNPEQLLRDWERLPDNVRESLLPRLLVSTRGWKAWSVDPRGRQMWLEHIFEKAGIPFYGDLDGTSQSDGHTKKRGIS